jgi:ribosomal protein RSM22 (predicted rRNA methylase)
VHQFELLKSKTNERLKPPANPEETARFVKRISDMYIARNSDFSGLWQKPELVQAYLSYFMPLNILRLLYVIEQAIQSEFFSGLENLIDVGSGPGTLDFALCEKNIQFSTSHFVELAKPAIEAHKNLLRELNLSTQNKTWAEKLNVSGKTNAGQSEPSKTLVAFSYALNEMAELPSWALNSEALLIVEPSTQEQGRNLQMLRQKLIDQGFSIWAPCTHQKACPLLTHSKTDWCHSRIHIELTPALKAIEKHLPIKNQTLTFSYLLARKKSPHVTSSQSKTSSAKHSASPATKARVIGDTLFERGKIRQAVCRGPEREFLSWLTRHGEPTLIARGKLIEIPEGTEERGGEIRLPQDFES